MAFEDDLGIAPSQSIAHDYAGSASELVTRTISLWYRNLIQYIIIVGIIGATLVGGSFLLLSVMFDLFGTLSTDPISYMISLFLDPISDFTLVTVSMGFAIFAFVLNAIIAGAAIKFTLDEYGEKRGDIGTSFSHSIGRVLNVIVVQLILSAFIAIVLTPFTILAFRALEMIDLSDPLNPIIPPQSIELLMSALGILIIGGIFLIYLQVRFTPTLAIVIDSDLSAFDSLKRSWELTSGNFFHVFGGLILLILATFVLGLIVSVVLAFTFLPESYTALIQSLISALLFGSLNYIFATVLYRDLDSRKGISDFPEYVL
ncbi:MAG: hypothetical protein AM325_008605 [Candidatus Thorarchaeota archaeon SMTZ1-45]|nr:MAG: hypothetical protein AM325_10320 [Candidatus Thorarchaeota archaeon SMTZ1-45]